MVPTLQVAENALDLLPGQHHGQFAPPQAATASRLADPAALQDFGIWENASLALKRQALLLGPSGAEGSDTEEVPARSEKDTWPGSGSQCRASSADWLRPLLWEPVCFSGAPSREVPGISPRNNSVRLSATP
jgi:hypothetical protein